MKSLHTILIVEDDRMTRQMLREIIEGQDFVAIESIGCERTLSILDNHEVDTILLDLHLSDGDGVNFLPQIRQRTNVPVIVVSGAEDEQSKVECFEQGADDFVTKPFTPDVLMARIRAHLRRVDDLSMAGLGHRFSSHKIALDKWIVDPHQCQLFDDNNKSAGLTVHEFRLIEYLIENSFRAVSRKDLCEALRDENYIPTQRAIDVKVARIRSKLDDESSGEGIIRTIRGLGYMINNELVSKVSIKSI